MTTCKDAIKIFEESEVRNKEKHTAEEATNVRHTLHNDSIFLL